MKASFLEELIKTFQEGGDAIGPRVFRDEASMCNRHLRLRRNGIIVIGRNSSFD